MTLRLTGRVLTYGVLAGFSLLFLLPIGWLFVTALKTGADLASFPVTWWPADPQWGNFTKALDYVPFAGYLRNSVTVSVIFATLATLTSALVGYGLARIKGAGRSALFKFMLGTILINSLVTMLPTFIMFSRAGLVNTYIPWVVWGLAAPTYLAFMFRQFFAALPAELEEAAVIDGCSRVGIFWRIALPLAKPALATAFILSFVGTWGDFIAPLLFLDSDTTTLAVAVVNGYVDPQGGTLNNLMSAGALLYTAPVILLFAVTQKLIMQGVATSGLK
ncbi:multiple sugar transport system permease protein [Kribbella voronezhensis]|uniref:Multiple sugar transport system permease protein n=1 Tax=Kribbella voronezhensis TaxID=2512212 RepID=A0A4R7TA36_9ACTN|nr:carbohydrate ABC transporter permease [Kribbella voronezhensis]TDU88844.1 multiple sugar transport system permease protein [Kribbella voronezhensis]